MALAATVPCWAVLAATGPSRLSGIVVGPKDRVAIFADPENGSPVAVREGDWIGSWHVEAITADTVLVTGPDGPHLLGLEGANATAAATPAAAPGSPVLAAAEETGMSVGRLATQHDACVRRGFAPASGRPGEDQFRAMLDAMANLPARTGEDAAKDAPVKEMARAMRSGWEAAVRADAGIALDAGSCRRIGELWTQAAARLGMR